MPEPLAYFLTFTTYGSRLAGDERGTVDRGHNRFDTPRIAPNTSHEGFSRSLMTSPALVLDFNQRGTVDRAIRERCATMGWDLYALNVRTNHVHAVVAAAAKPELVLNSFKSWATRRLRNEGQLDLEQKVWTRHGSTRYVWDERSLETVCHYTMEMQ